MRLLTWNSQGGLTLTDDLSDNLPPYAILSHTWGPDSDEVTFADMQQGQGQNKAGFAKIRFCGEQARRDNIDHFWVDTCCIDKTNHVELSEAITSMFRWYRDAQKCYVYLSDVSTGRSDVIGGAISAWESSFRTSRWFTRGWTLQELLAPRVVEFFSCELEFLGSKGTLTRQIHEITTIPVAALQSLSLSQFPVAERIRWTERRDTKKKEDKAYCLLGIFDVFMTFIYGEGDNALHRLQRKLSKKFGSDVDARLGGVVEGRLERSSQKPAPSTDINDLVERAPEFHEIAPVSRPGGSRPAKRIRTAYDASMLGTSNGLPYGNTSHVVMMADHVQQPGQSSQHNAIAISGDNYNALLKSLLFDRIDFRVNNVKKALLSTCQWLFRHPHFQTWHENGGSDQHSGFLWIKGKPGSGKSTLMKAALEQVRMSTSDDRGRYVIVPYFFNARASAPLEKSSLGLYRTILHHLVSSRPPLQALFAERFALKDPGQSGEKWTAEELQDFLYDSVTSSQSFELCLLIDALDEAEHEDDVRQMISFLNQLSDRASSAGSVCRLKICLSSRHYPHISVGRGLSLVVEDQSEHGHDIETYITKRLMCLDGPGKGDLRAEILNKSGRIFLWVVLVVEMLNKMDDHGAALSEMRARLDTIPAGLNELFKEILTKSDHGIETSVLFFQWMSFRLRPLEPAELFVAMEYSRSPHDSTRVLPTELSAPPPDRLARFILNCSRGLVEVVEVAPSQAKVVQFIHETVREFLLKKNGLASIVPALALNLAGISHEILRIACLRCISTSNLTREYEQYCNASHKSNALLETFRSEMRLKLPFLDYAIVHLLDHAEQAQKHGVSQQAFLTNHADTKGLWVDSHRLWWNVLERYKTKKVQSGTTLVHFIRERRYFSLLPVLLSAPNTAIICCDHHGSVLLIASHNDYDEIVQLLLDRGADVNAQGRQYGSALQAASAHGHEKIVQMLLDKGANVNAGGGYYGSALYAASAGGYERVVQILLEKGVNVDAEGGDYSSALQAASAGGYEKIVQMLLDKGTHVNAEGGYYGSALYAASAGGYEKVVQMLLGKGTK